MACSLRSALMTICGFARVDFPEPERLERRIPLAVEQVHACGSDPPRDGCAVSRIDGALAHDRSRGEPTSTLRTAGADGVDKQTRGRGLVGMESDPRLPACPVDGDFGGVQAAAALWDRPIRIARTDAVVEAKARAPRPRRDRCAVLPQTGTRNARRIGRGRLCRLSGLQRPGRSRGGRCRRVERVVGLTCIRRANAAEERSQSAIGHAQEIRMRHRRPATEGNRIGSHLARWADLEVDEILLRPVPAPVDHVQHAVGRASESGLGEVDHDAG